MSFMVIAGLSGALGRLEVEQERQRPLLEGTLLDVLLERIDEDLLGVPAVLPDLAARANDPPRGAMIKVGLPAFGSATTLSKFSQREVGGLSRIARPL